MSENKVNFKVYLHPIITMVCEPKVTLPEHINWQSDAEFDADILVEFGGRLCYLSFGEDAGIDGHKTIKGRSSNKEYIENILRTGHGSVTEHANFSFLFEGVSRSFSHEMVRHRHTSPSQLSQRYVDESTTAFVKPPIVDPNSPAMAVFMQSCKGALVEYRTFLGLLEEQLAADESLSATMRKKRAREAARAVLPNAAETKLLVTGNIRAWRNFIELRADPHADLEIRAVAVQVAAMLQEKAPNLLQDLEIMYGDDGFEEAKLGYGAV